MQKSINLLVTLFLFSRILLHSQSRFVVSCNKYLLQASLDTAFAQLGVREKTGRNDGSEIKKYLESVGLKEGNPYCAAGQYYCFYSASKALLLPVSEIPILKTGSANMMYNESQKSGHKSNYLAYKYDLLVWKSINSWSGHIERIFATGKAGWVSTIGFNTSAGTSNSQNEVQGVFKRKRNIFHPLGRLKVRGIIGFNY